MAWLNNGNWEGLPIRYLAEIIHQLTTAINDREKALGLGTTSDSWSWFYGLSGTDAKLDLTKFYYYNNGTFSEKRYPTIADLSNLNSTTPLNPHSGYMTHFTSNITRIRTAIERLIEAALTDGVMGYSEAPNKRWPLSHGDYFDPKCKAVFMKADNQWFTGIADLLSMGSYGNSWITYSTTDHIDHYRFFADKRIWLQMKEAIDRLKYVMWCPQIIARRAMYRDPVYGNTYPYPSKETVWNAAMANTPYEVANNATYTLQWSCSSNLQYVYYNAGPMISYAEWDWSTHKVRGSIVGQPNLCANWTNNTTTGHAYNIDFNFKVLPNGSTNAYTFPAASGIASGYAWIPWTPKVEEVTTLAGTITTPENSGWLGNPAQNGYYGSSFGAFPLINNYEGVTYPSIRYPEHYTHLTTDVSALMTYA